MAERGPGQVAVSSVLPSSGAARGGVLPGDRLVSVGGRAVTTTQDVSSTVAAASVGDRVPVVVERAGRRVRLRVVLGPRPSPSAVLQALVGTPAPAVRLRRVGGSGDVDLAALRGRVALVYFWSIHCGACRMAMPALLQWHRSLGPRGLSIIAVTDDPVQDLTRVLRSAPMPFAVAHDAGGKVEAAYWVSAVPTFFVVDRAGAVVLAVEGWDPSRRGSMDAALRSLLGQRGP